ncbi:MAG: glycosyl transferase group 1 [Oscillospiraceae bacterium]|jgi:glycosyltransferase involved in cell wall biosynthesis|nr:glycosyl transferase group 1 [Oscillospiraceae bacterium]
MGMEYRPYYLSAALARMGEKPSVLTASFSHLRKKNPEVKNDLVCLDVQGISFCVLKTPQYTGNGVERAQNAMQFAIGLWRNQGQLVKMFKPDAVIVSSTHPFDFFAAKALAQKTGAVLIFEVHDIWPLSLIELYGFSKNHPLMRLIDYLMRCAFEQSDAVISLLPRFDNYCQDRKFTPKRIVHIPNAFAQEMQDAPPPEHLQALKEAKENYSAVVMYAGGIARANAVDELLDIAALLPNIGFVCVGEGVEKDELFRIKTNNVIFLPAVSHPQVQTLLQQADLLWLGIRNLSVYRYGIAMNKLYDYMASGRPVIISAPCKYHPVSYAKCGITVPASDKIKTRNAILRMLALTGKQRQIIGMRGRKAIERKYRYEVVAERYKTLLEELSGGKQEKT